MDTEKNGQPSMEEILASIRRLMAEEPASQVQVIDFDRRPIMLEGDGDDGGQDFNLPAIFRASPPQQTEKSPAILGRLTDAIRQATGTREGVVHSESPQVSAPPSEEVRADGSLSSLASARRSAEDAVHVEVAAPISRPPVDVAALPEGGDVKRVMAAFKDTKFRSMGSMSAAVVPFSPVVQAPVPGVGEVQPSPVSGSGAADAASEGAPAPGDHARVNFATIIPERLGAAAPLTPPAASPAVPPSAAVQVHAGVVGEEPVQSAPPLPELPASVTSSSVLPGQPSQSAERSSSIEDTTADLLRPMLRQWLADNMPRMVEKALHIEVAESIKDVRKLSNE